MVTDKQKLNELRRELKMRKEVYPRQVILGKMTKEMAAGRIKIIEAIIKDYSTKGGPQHEQGSLF